MQLQLQLLTFQDDQGLPFRTINVGGDPWFVAADVCRALDIGNPTEALRGLEDDERMTLSIPEGQKSGRGGAQSLNVISESGLYGLIFRSRKQQARDFRRWVTKEVIPQIRKGGAYSLPGAQARAIPIFVRRFNDNWNQVDAGYFSIISELYIRVHGRFEQAGHIIADYGPDGKELRPDVSVGKLFPKWLKLKYPHFEKEFKFYTHILPAGAECQARQYKLIVLPAFIEYVDTVWLIDHAPAYLESRDVAALQILPKLLPPPS